MRMEISSGAAVQMEARPPGTVEMAVVSPGGELLPEYTGETTVTPTDAAQTLETKDRIVRENIVIERIPQNYGKIIYNGAYLRVE